MTIINGYATRAQLIAELDSTGSATLDTGRIDRVVEQASRVIERWTVRRFYPAIWTRYYTPRRWDFLTVDDLLAVTTLQTDDDGDRVYENVWTATDYDLEPYNAPDHDEPYAWIRPAPQSSYLFPKDVRAGVEITGTWGYYEKTLAAGTTVSGAHTAATTSLATGDVSAFSVGHLLKIGDEYLRVDGVDPDTSVLAVARGVNGSTAAALAGGESIHVLTFPAITEVTLRLARRMWELSRAPLGIATAGVAGLNGSTAGTRWIQEDKDMQMWLEPFGARVVPR